MNRRHPYRHWIAAAALSLMALGASAHEGHRERDASLEGGTCTTSRGDRYRIVEAISLRRSARRQLSRLPLHRERLGSMDTLIVIEPYETPIEPVLHSVEKRLENEE